VTQPLGKLSVSFSSCKPFQAATPYSLDSFGEVSSRVGDGDSCDTTEAIIESSDEHACKLVYPNSISYDNIAIKVSKKEGFISFCCPRAFQARA
jgi:hypothetical protein